MITASNWDPPAWWCTPEQQLERARQLWPNAILPEWPKEFIPLTKSEVLLLHVPDMIDALWDKIVVPQKDGVSYTKCWEPFAWNPRRAPNKPVYREPVWLAFDPEHGKRGDSFWGECPDLFWGQANIAADEVLSAMIQFPEWALAWDFGVSMPMLSGYRLKDDWGRDLVPIVHGQGLQPYGLWLRTQLVSLPGFMSSPTVREC